MCSRTSLTIRATGLDQGSLTTELLEQKCREVCEINTKPKRFALLPRHENKPGSFLVSLAPQGDSNTGTLTFPSEKLKQRALESLALEGLQVDDTFADLTVLHSAPEPDVDICAVHGLNGNAFDTFAWEGQDMWLRDYLPKPRPQYPDLARLRVMTFGYSSLVRDNKNTTGLDEWSLGLLQSVSSLRRSSSERSRPIIFVCHSLGGIVARQAMIRLERFPYEGLKLENCGLLFLSTPHSGTVEANWSDFWLLFAKGAGVARGHTFTQLLSAFNQASVNAQEHFGDLKPVPPVECLYETRKTVVAGTGRTIVSAASAGLVNNRAQPMLNVDHRTIARFPNKHHPGYFQILDCIDKIRQSLVSRQMQQEASGSDPGAATELPVLRGGNAVGGNAASHVPGGIATAGSAAGGSVDTPSTAQKYSVVGGDGRGGDAVGDTAVGGSAVGGNVRWGLGSE